ncbi:MAG TPA: M20/M25/M40 family metallo-hydrolase [Thermoanaerobaculia bacterium]|nr:M20/M25/M40 family metallo-hydrolase [Thermoanaerobaculia bacterium]
MSRPPLALLPRSPLGRPLVVSLVGLALLGLAASCLAQPAGSPAPSAPPAGLPAEVRATAARLRDQALQGTRAYEIVRSLTVEVGPRPAGSKAHDAAVAWGVSKLKELGFSNVHAEKAMVPHWVRGEESGEIVAPYPQPVHLAALGGSVGTPDGGIEAPVIAVPSLDALDEVTKLDPAQVKGKIVFYDVHMERTRDASGYGKAVRVRGAGASRAAKLGAVAVLIRSIGTDHNRTPHTGAMDYQDGVAQIPAAALSVPDAELLAAQVATGKPVTFRLKLGAHRLPEVETASVVGDIPGREKPEEIVLLGAHLDSWDLGTGAIDDGAGIAIVTEAARLIGQLPQKPRRTVRVVFYANEEFGTSGAKAYAEAHKAELSHHVLATEADLGAGRVWRIASRVDPAALPIVADLARLLEVEQGKNDSGGGADLGPLSPAHVPVVALAQDATAYFDYHHTANDTLDKIDPKDLDQNVASWAAVAYVAAEMPGDFGRAPEVGGRE